jgi:hypothetical protein
MIGIARNIISFVLWDRAVLVAHAHAHAVLVKMCSKTLNKKKIMEVKKTNECKCNVCIKNRLADQHSTINNVQNPRSLKETGTNQKAIKLKSLTS